MRTPYRYIILLWFIASVATRAQETDSLQVNVDSLVMLTDSIPDSVAQTLPFPLSKDAIDAKIEYGSTDSIIMDNVERLVHLYGDAYVNYGSLELKAEYIRLDLNTNIALAEGRLDSTGHLAGTPVFKDGAQNIEAARMRYNFKTRKGLVYDVSTMEADMHIHGAVTKFYGEGGEEGRENHTIYSSDAIFTTCDHPHPHFGIRSKKQKIVPGKVAVVGPSNLEIGGVPTPFFLPFGFFPLKTGKRGGLIFPNDYEYSQRWGFGLQNVGYYFPISDHLDFTLLTDFYLRGSYGVKGEVRYKKRYKYNGSVNMGFSEFQQEFVNDSSEIDLQKERSFSIRLRHDQDPKAHPYRKIGGSINIETNQYDKLNFNNARNVLNNSLNSNFSITQAFPGTPFTATLGLSHRQNTQTRRMQMSLPRLDLRMKQQTPFKRKRRTGPEKWYEKVTLTYNSSLRYDLNGPDTAFFVKQTFDDGKFGMQHNIGTNVTFNVLKYFQLSPFVNVKETWYTKKNKKFFDRSQAVIDSTIIIDPLDGSTIVEYDTTRYGDIDDMRSSGFNAIHEYNAGVSLFTKLYGTARFKSGWLRGIRHTLKPTISMNYTPDYTGENLGYFDELEIQRGTDDFDTLQYSIFDQEIFGGPSSQGKRMALNYSLLNLLEAKTFSKRDSTFNKMNILDNLNVSGSYNFAADSLQWSPIRASGNVRIFKGLATVKMAATFDPYALDENNRRINTFQRDVNGKFLRFDQARISFNTGMKVQQFKNIFKGKKTQTTARSKRARSTSNSQSQKSTLASLFDDLRVTYQYTLSTLRLDDGRIIMKPSVHSIALRGEIPLTPKWSLMVGNLDYNFVRKRASYPDLTLSRDLHCWNMGISWQPERNTYNFYLRVKPGSLDFIKLPYRQNRVDGFGR